MTTAQNQICSIMVADAAILAEIAIQFGNVTRPRHFTVEDGDFEWQREVICTNLS